MGITVSVWDEYGFSDIARGPQGTRGPTGERGLRGGTGELGPTGLQGLTGPRGRQGIVGVAGKGAIAPVSFYTEAKKINRLLYAPFNFGISATDNIYGDYSDGSYNDYIAIYYTDDEIYGTIKINSTNPITTNPQVMQFSVTGDIGASDIKLTEFWTRNTNSGVKISIYINQNLALHLVPDYSPDEPTFPPISNELVETRRLLYEPTDLRLIQTYQNYFFGDFSDARGEDFISLNINGGRINGTIKLDSQSLNLQTNSFVRSGNIGVDTIYLTKFEMYTSTHSYGPVYRSIYLKPDLSLSLDNSSSLIMPLYADESPPRLYLDRSVDGAPVQNDNTVLVSSGGVATSYCSLIDKIAASKGLSAAQVAQMKALYGA